LRMMPNFVVTAPADAAEMKGVLEFALALQRPVCIRYPKDSIAAEQITPASNEPFVLGKSATVRSGGTGTKATIISYGSVLIEAIEAGKLLEQDGIEVNVINARFAAPLDSSIIEVLKQGRPVVTVEDHGSAGGFGSSVLESAAGRIHGFEPGCAVRILGVPRRFIRHDSRTNQLMEAGINADKIAEAVREMLANPRAGAI
ncbi:MAG: transketolase C-terminal domain-containing protein, partial [Sedimentisphaerales bacterium]